MSEWEPFTVFATSPTTENITTKLSDDTSGAIVDIYIFTGARGTTLPTSFDAVVLPFPVTINAKVKSVKNCSHGAITTANF